MTALLGIIAALAAVVSALLYRAGRTDGAAKRAEAKVEAKEKMSDAANSVDRSRGGVSDRLRDGKF